MKHIFKTSIFFIIISCTFHFCKSESDEENDEPYVVNGDSILIADFENGAVPLNFGGDIGSWANNGKPEVEISFENVNGSANSSLALKISISENDGNGNNGWTGGGLVLTLSDNLDGINLKDFNYLKFEIKFDIESQLSETKIKLEDKNSSLNGDLLNPERSISDYIVINEGQWQSVEIPLNDFITKVTGDPLYWTELDINSVLNFVTVSVNDLYTNNEDGVFYIDNIVISK